MVILFQKLTSVICKCWRHNSNFTDVILLLIFVNNWDFLIWLGEHWNEVRTPDGLCYWLLLFFQTIKNFKCSWKICNMELTKYLMTCGLTHILMLTNYFLIASTNHKGVTAHCMTNTVWNILKKFYTVLPSLHSHSAPTVASNHILQQTIRLGATQEPVMIMMWGHLLHNHRTALLAFVTVLDLVLLQPDLEMK